MVALQAQASDASIRQTQAQSPNADKMGEVLNNPVISSLKADLARSEVRLQEMSARFGDSHPSMLETRASIAEIRARIEAETRRIVGSVGVNNTISRQREGELRAALEAQRNKVLKLKAMRDEGLMLAREAENVQRLYEQVTARTNQSSLESQSNQTNISLLSEARAPNDASSPRVLLNTVLGSIIGLVLAVVAALGFESVDRRLRLPSDIVDALALPIIGSIPKPERNLLGGTSKPAMQNRLLAPAQAAGAGGKGG